MHVRKSIDCDYDREGFVFFVMAGFRLTLIPVC